MIWFSCQQCGKTHSRPESASGATIFCECGTGTIVPWESSAAEPSVPPPLPDVPAALKLEPVTFDAVPSKPGPPSRARKRARLRRRDPLFCLNHEEVARHGACADCSESFCRGCLVSFDDATLCGPCKNYRVKNLQRALPPSNLAIVSMLLALLSAPVTLAFLPAGHAGFPWLSLLALVPQGLAAALAMLALRGAAKDLHAAGRSLAFTGIVSAAVTTLLIILLTMYTPHSWT